MVYLPPQSYCEITAASEIFDAGILSAPSTATAPPVLLDGVAVVKKQGGRDNWQRTVYSALGEDVPAERLVAGETLSPPCNWSSFPPHKHDCSNSRLEALLEEVYFFCTKPARGLGVIWTYMAVDEPDGISTVFAVGVRDTVLLPRSYHRVVGGPGYQLH